MKPAREPLAASVIGILVGLAISVVAATFFQNNAGYPRSDEGRALWISLIVFVLGIAIALAAVARLSLRLHRASPVVPAGSGRNAALALALGGLLAVIGSFQTWGTCPDSSCGEPGIALMALWETSGVEFGPGLVTAVLGLMLASGGIGAFRRGVSSGLRVVPVVLALLLLATVGAYILRWHVFPTFKLYGPEIGVILVIAGGLVALAASVRLRRTAPSELTG